MVRHPASFIQRICMIELLLAVLPRSAAWLRGSVESFGLRFAHASGLQVIVGGSDFQPYVADAAYQVIGGGFAFG